MANAPKLPAQDSKQPVQKSKEPEQDKVVHEYDGILEYDNRLPNWWLYTLFGSIIFAALYWAYYQQLGIGKTPLELYQAEMAREEAKKEAQAAALQPVTPEILLELSRDSQATEAGKQVYGQMCAACHGPTGGGLIGPNLTDEFWVHGGSPDKIYAVVKDGVLAKGMPAWGGSLGEEKVRAVTAYLLTLRNTKVAGGKAPEGEEEL